jgi:hypothetical protein
VAKVANNGFDPKAFHFPSLRRDDRIKMWGTTSPRDKLTAEFGDGS